MKFIGTKKQSKLATQVVANYLIGKDAINRACISRALGLKEYDDAIQHITDNTIDLLIGLVGFKGMLYYTKKYGLGVEGGK